MEFLWLGFNRKAAVPEIEINVCLIPLLGKETISSCSAHIEKGIYKEGTG